MKYMVSLAGIREVDLVGWSRQVQLKQNLLKIKLCEECYTITAEMIVLYFKLLSYEVMYDILFWGCCFCFLKEFKAIKNYSHFATSSFFPFLKMDFKACEILKLDSSVATKVPEN